YSYYSLVPQAVAFGLMVLFTGFAVIAAINYNKQIIAHIGLVGAYAVPFLLSDGSGKVVILFSYMAIINTGILAIAVQRYWKPLYYSSFALTWLIYASWYVTKYSMPVHFRLALIFLAIFFIIFYLTFLTYKLFKKEKFGPQDVMLYLLNSFIFYGLGYASLSDHPTGKQLLGLFTLANAVVHFAASVAIYRNKLADRNLFYLVSGLVLVFITIAIPVQLDGNWVTLLWAGEAAILFWIGRTRKVTFYEMLSYPLMLLALFSILQDWTSVYNTYTPGNIASKITPFININFMSSVLFVAAFGFMTWTNVKNKIISAADSKNEFLSKASYLAPAILLMVLFGAFATEISCYWQQRYIDSVFSMTQAGAKGYAYHQGDEDLKKFQAIWLINYSLLFFTLLSFINIKKIKSEYLGYINLLLNVGAIAAFLVIGLFTLSELRDTYISQSLAQYFDRGVSHMVIRYISLGFVAALVFACYQYIKQEFIKLDLKIGFDVLFYTTVLWIASSELIGWMSLYRSQQSYKLGLSILWGIYSLLLIGLGIWKRKKHLRIGAIVLFAITLVKLFFYDIADLDTIAKTIVFVSLGVLLLIISFLYNKYKNIITDETQS
ncbi:MAG: hypothetical protein JWO06_2957, partial [Bacteroidota bacterium]|nr:hypothetical protein [Bacteroidota bacterium]